MKSTKYVLLFLIFCLSVSPTLGQDENIDQSDNKVAGIIEIGYINPIYFSKNINSSHHKNWFGWNTEFGLCFIRRIDIVLNFSRTKSDASSAYFLNKVSKNKVLGIKMRYHFHKGDRIFISPTIGIRNTNWKNGLKLLGKGFLFGADLSYSLSKTLSLKLKFELVRNSYNERLPESIDLHFSGFYFQPGISLIGYFSEY